MEKKLLSEILKIHYPKASSTCIQNTRVVKSTSHLETANNDRNKADVFHSMQKEGEGPTKDGTTVATNDCYCKYVGICFLDCDWWNEKLVTQTYKGDKTLLVLHNLRIAALNWYTLNSSEWTKLYGITH